VVVYPEWEEKAREAPEPTKPIPGDPETIKAMNKKVSKRAFEGIVRFVFIDKKSDFTGAHIGSIFGAFQMFAALNLNFFRPNRATLTKKTIVSRIPPRRPRLLEKRKKMMYQAYLDRTMPQKHLGRFGLKLKTSIFNIEELATMYHPPSISVKAPKLQPLESRKGAPPVDLPTVGEV